MTDNETEEQEQEEQSEQGEEQAEGNGEADQVDTPEETMAEQVAVHLESIAASLDRFSISIERFIDYEMEKSKASDELYHDKLKAQQDVDSIAVAEKNIDVSTVMAYQQMYQCYLLSKLEQYKASEIDEDEMLKDINVFKEKILILIRSFVKIESNIS